MSLNYIDWGTIDYKEALDKQEALFNDKVNKKLNGDKNIKEDFIVCEHPHVYTIGLHGKDTNMLVSKDFLDKIVSISYVDKSTVKEVLQAILKVITVELYADSDTIYIPYICSLKISSCDSITQKGLETIVKLEAIPSKNLIEEVKAVHRSSFVE